MKLTRPRLALVGAVSLVALTGCSGGGGSDSASTAADTGVKSPTASLAGRAPAFASRLADAANGGRAVDASTVVEQTAVIKNGDISVTTADPQHARDRVDALLARFGGSVDDEQTVYDKQGAITDSSLVLRVPVATFSRAMRKLEHLGTVVHSSSNAKDVTTEVIDVQQRLKTLRISLHDLNAFQRRATTIDQLLRFENAITQRRGQYQSLKAQRDHLVSQTSRSTISLDISVPPTKVTQATKHHEAGFTTGLEHGWKALSGTVVVALTALGAVLPFAVVLAAVGVPVWWLVRRVRRVRPALDAPAGD
jgi:Domain of unknown function (DUF4349)